MKTLTLVLFITLQLLGSAPEINEHKTDLYFANGINTTYKEASEGYRKLFKILIQNNPEIFEKVQGYHYNGDPETELHLAYNNTYGLVADLLESSSQKFGYDLSNMSEVEPLFNSVAAAALVSMSTPAAVTALVVSDLLSDLYYNSLKKEIQDAEIDAATKQQLLDFYFPNGEGRFSINSLSNLFQSLESYDLSRQISSYQRSLDKGHKILVVAHSQGNLFTNKAYSLLSHPFKESNFRMFGMATPAGSVLGNTAATSLDYITIKGDQIAATGLDGNRLPSNIDITDLEDENSGLKHFLATYLNTPTTVNALIRGVNHKIVVTPSPSVYEVDINTSATYLCDPQPFFDPVSNETLYALVFSKTGQINKLQYADNNSSLYAKTDHKINSAASKEFTDHCWISDKGDKIFTDLTEIYPLEIKSHSTEYNRLFLTLNNLQNIKNYTLSLEVNGTTELFPIPNENKTYDAETDIIETFLDVPVFGSFTKFDIIATRKDDINVSDHAWLLTLRDPTIKGELNYHEDTQTATHIFATDTKNVDIQTFTVLNNNNEIVFSDTTVTDTFEVTGLPLGDYTALLTQSNIITSEENELGFSITKVYPDAEINFREDSEDFSFRQTLRDNKDTMNGNGYMAIYVPLYSDLYPNTHTLEIYLDGELYKTYSRDSLRRYPLKITFRDVPLDTTHKVTLKAYNEVGRLGDTKAYVATLRCAGDHDAKFTGDVMFEFDKHESIINPNGHYFYIKLNTYKREFPNSLKMKFYIDNQLFYDRERKGWGSSKRFKVENATVNESHNLKVELYNSHNELGQTYNQTFTFTRGDKITPYFRSYSKPLFGSYRRDRNVSEAPEGSEITEEAPGGVINIYHWRDIGIYSSTAAFYSVNVGGSKGSLKSVINSGYGSYKHSFRVKEGESKEVGITLYNVFKEEGETITFSLKATNPASEGVYTRSGFVTYEP